MLLAVMMCGGMVGCQKKAPREELEEAKAALMQRPIKDEWTTILKLKQLTENETDPRVAEEARMMLGQIEMSKGRNDLARGHFQKVIENVGITDIMGFQALSFKISTYVNEKQFDTAVEELLALQETLKPEQDVYIDVEMMLSEVYMTKGDFERAEEILKKQIREERNQQVLMAAIEKLVAIYYNNNEIDNAIGVYQNHLDKHPKSKNKLLFQVGIAFFHDKKGETEKADELYEKSFSEYRKLIDETLDQKEKTKYMFEFARALELRDEQEKAIEQLKGIAEKFPDTQNAPFALMEVGRIMVENQKKYEDALKWYSDLEMKYQNTQIAPAVRQRIAYIQYMQQQQAKADAATTTTQPTE